MPWCAPSGRSRSEMADHFSAFSFVDRITDIAPGTRARGQFAVPAGLAEFSPGLVAEAIGQLAAWVVMARERFQRRPLAALADEACILGDAIPGCGLELGVEIERWDDDAVAYAGWARIGEAPILTLRQCVGVLLPLQDFDAPDAARQHFETLCGPGAPCGRFRGISAPAVQVVDCELGKRLRAVLQVPQSAAFFADHFPLRPVFPATLLVDAGIRLATELARGVLGEHARPRRAAGVKLRSFILPGQVVEIAARVSAAADAGTTVALTAQVDGKRAATARVEMVSGERA